MTNKITPVTILIVIVLLVGMGGIAFYGGMKYGQMHRAPFTGGQAMGVRTGMLGMGFAGRGISGQVTSLDNTSMTLTLRDGSTQIIPLGTSVSVSKTVAGSVADIATGDTVTVVGTTASDGTFSPTSIQIRPATSTAP